MTPKTNETIPNNFLFWLLLIPVLLGCLGMTIAIYYTRQDNGNVLNQIPPIDYRHIPPELIGYQQTSFSHCPIQGTPQCFAVQNDSTFIVGVTHPNVLYFFDEKGKLLHKADLEDEPTALTCGTKETMFPDKIVVAHPTKITIYDEKGQFEMDLHVWQPYTITNFGGIPKPYYTNNKTEIHSLVLTEDSLFAADSGNRCVHRINDDDKSNTVIGFTLDIHGMLTESSSNPTEYISTNNVSSFEGFVVYASPITLTYSPQSKLLYITNPGKHRVEVFTPDGLHKPELSWGEPSGEISGFVGCCNPIGLAVLDDERVLTVEKSASRIKIFGQDRKLDCVVAGANVLEDIPAGIERKPVAPGGRYFSAVPLSDGRIVVFDLADSVLRFFTPLPKH